MNAAMPAPIFILAAPFSGASSLAALLSGHPQLYALPELNLFMADRVGELLEIFRIGQGTHADGLLRALAQLESGAQEDAGIERARAWLEQRADWRCGAVIEHLAQRVAPRRLVIPDSESPLRPMDLRRLREQCPGATLLHLTRHPYTQGLLHAHWLDGRLFVAPDFKDHATRPPQIDPQIGWLRCMLNITRAAPDALQLRSEDFADDEVRATAALCAQLGLPPAPLRAPEDWDFAGYGPPLAPYGLEAEVLEALPPALVEHARTQARLAAPLPWRAGQGFAREVIEAARGCGYT